MPTATTPAHVAPTTSVKIQLLRDLLNAGQTEYVDIQPYMETFPSDQWDWFISEKLLDGGIVQNPHSTKETSVWQVALLKFLTEYATDLEEHAGLLLEPHFMNNQVYASVNQIIGQGAELFPLIALDRNTLPIYGESISAQGVLMTEDLLIPWDNVQWQLDRAKKSDVKPRPELHAAAKISSKS